MPSLPSRPGEVRYFRREINDTYILSEDVFRPGDLEESIFFRRLGILLNHLVS
jgi:hypothetical protein